jgi:hypothetical protein
VKVEDAAAKPTLPIRLAQSLFVCLHTRHSSLENQLDSIINLLLELLNMLALLTQCSKLLTICHPLSKPFLMVNALLAKAGRHLLAPGVGKWPKQVQIMLLTGLV